MKERSVYHVLRRGDSVQVLCTKCRQELGDVPYISVLMFAAISNHPAYCSGCARSEKAVGFKDALEVIKQALRESVRCG